MDTQKNELRDRILADGWSMNTAEEWQTPYWADEIWLLESTWSPVGFKAFLTFLVDPQVDNWQNRRKGDSVWAVRASADAPASHPLGNEDYVMPLNKGWAENVPALLEFLSNLRKGARG